MLEFFLIKLRKACNFIEKILQPYLHAGTVRSNPKKLWSNLFLVKTRLKLFIKELKIALKNFRSFQQNIFLDQLLTSDKKLNLKTPCFIYKDVYQYTRCVWLLHGTGWVIWGKWHSGIVYQLRIGKSRFETHCCALPRLGIQPRYKVPGNLWVK